MVHFLFIRHGETQDNLKKLWAGSKDSPLSNHGVRQSEALAEELSCINLSAIYSSNLQRARTTAQIICKPQCSDDLVVKESHLLQEQNFGGGEGRPIATKDKNLTMVQHYAKGKFPVIYSRNHHFPGGESLDALAERARQTLKDIMMPYILEQLPPGKPQKIVAIVSHGIFIAELLLAILKKETLEGIQLRGLKNTAWTKVEVLPAPRVGANVPTSSPIPLDVKLLAFNRYSHLSTLHRQKGIGSIAYDPAQKDIRAFFGGQGTSKIGSKRQTPSDSG